MTPWYYHLRIAWRKDDQPVINGIRFYETTAPAGCLMVYPDETVRWISNNFYE